MPLQIFCAALLALPWLWPFTGGPLASVQPYLVAAGVAAVLLALWPRAPARGAACAAAGWAAAAGVSAVIALLQYFDLENAFYPWINIAVPGQAFGNLRQPNQLATLLVMGLLSLRWLQLRGALPRLAVGALAALLLAALAATASRVGLVELLAVALLTLWWAARTGAPVRRLAWALVAGVAVYVLAALLLPWALQDSEGLAGRALVDRLQHAESTCGSRFNLYGNVLHLIALRPWTGWGWGDLAWAHYITLYDGPRFCHILDNAHNLPLHLAVTLGVPAALLICGALAWGVWRGRPWAERDAARQLAWGVLLVIGIHSLVEYPLWYAPFQIAAAVCVTLLWATRAGRKAAAPRRAPVPVPAVRAALAAALLAAVGYAAWDYHRISQVYLPYEQRDARYRDDAMREARHSWLFAGPVRFAEVTSQPATRANAAWMLPAALQALHFSPEPRVITRVIESAALLGRDDVARVHLARFKAAFAADAREWIEDNRRVLAGARHQPDTASGAAPGSP